MHQIIAGVIKADLTDHFSIVDKISDLWVKKKLKPIYQRNLSNFYLDEFCFVIICLQNIIIF